MKNRQISPTRQNTNETKAVRAEQAASARATSFASRPVFCSCPPLVWFDGLINTGAFPSPLGIKPFAWHGGRRQRSRHAWNFAGWRPSPCGQSSPGRSSTAKADFTRRLPSAYRRMPKNRQPHLILLLARFDTRCQERIQLQSAAALALRAVFFLCVNGFLFLMLDVLEFQFF